MTNAITPTFFSWKIGAPAGFGVMTVGMLMAKLAARHGLAAAGYPEYPSLIQGGHNTFEVTMARSSVHNENVVATKRMVDCLVCLTKETLPLHARRLGAGSLVVYDPAAIGASTEEIERWWQSAQNVLAQETAIPDDVSAFTQVPVPLSELQASLKADKIMINTIAFGASAALLGADESVLRQLIADQFRGKAAEITTNNLDCVAAGYRYVREHFAAYCRPVLATVSNASVPVNTPSASTFDSTVESTSEYKSAAATPLVMTGNEAFALAAIASDCRFYCSYPMTPTSAVLEILSAYQEATGMVVKQAEDEVAVIAQALGASFAGVRSAVGTSGGGFALMVEHISYAGVAELPLVILLGQRPGPATGLPTWTEQGDLLFAVHAGHGEFPKIVLAPGDLDEIAELSVKAFDLADRYQTPVVILTDKYSAESHRSVDGSVFEKFTTIEPDRGKMVGSLATAVTDHERYQPTETVATTAYQSPTASIPQGQQIPSKQLPGNPDNAGGASLVSGELTGADGFDPILPKFDDLTTGKYLRYSDTPDGISPRLIPGTTGQFYQANSYEHLEDSHTTEDAAQRRLQVDKRARKMTTYLEEDWAAPAVYGSIGDAQLVLVTWGSQKIPARAAQLALAADGVRTALIHFTHLYPLHRAKVHQLFKGFEGKPVLLIENNATAQLGRLLREEIDLDIPDILRKYDGRPFFQEEITEAVVSRLQK